MFTLIGLGNPGPTYHRTRHNIGFLLIDEIAKRSGMKLQLKQALEAEIAEGDFEGKKILLCKPQTFMNASGRALQKMKRKFPFEPQELLVMYDDADLPFGDVRFKSGGSSAGHRGMQSILDLFPSGTSISRLRMGIGRPEHPDMALEDFVLQRWTQKEEEALPALMEKAIATIIKTYA